MLLVDIGGDFMFFLIDKQYRYAGIFADARKCLCLTIKTFLVAYKNLLFQPIKHKALLMFKR